ncbi:MAG: hypothetical protein AAF916_07515 [Planctomycetota bacterium]
MSYIPARLEDYESFVRNLYTKLTADPTAYGTTENAIIPFATAYEAFAAAYALTQDPSTRTKPTIAGRDTARVQLNEQLRPLVATLQASPAMTDAKREELELPIRDSQPTPVPVPSEMPQVLVDPPLGTTIHFRVVNAEGKRARPEGAAGVLVYTYLGDVAPTDLTQWQFRGLSTKYKNDLPFPADTTPGSRVFVTACWVNRKGQPGPACQPVNFNLPGGSVQQGFGLAA